MANLTKAQSEVLRWIERHQRRYGFTPSVREIAAGMGKGVTTIQYHIHNLVDRGAIKKPAGVHRSIEIQ